MDLAPVIYYIIFFRRGPLPTLLYLRLGYRPMPAQYPKNLVFAASIGVYQSHIVTFILVVQQFKELPEHLSSIYRLQYMFLHVPIHVVHANTCSNRQ